MCLTFTGAVGKRVLFLGAWRACEQGLCESHRGLGREPTQRRAEQAQQVASASVVITLP